MKVDTQNQQLVVPQLTKVKGRKPAEAQQAQEQVATKKDRVELSSQAALTAEISELQAVQVEKVQSIKERIEGGTYQVSGHDVAKKMLAKLSRIRRG